MAVRSDKEVKDDILKAIDRQIEWATLEHDAVERLKDAIESKNIVTVYNFENRAERTEKQLDAFIKSLTQYIDELRKLRPDLDEHLKQVEVKLTYYESNIKRRVVNPWFGKKGVILEILRAEPTDWEKLKTEAEAVLEEGVKPLITELQHLKVSISKEQMFEELMPFPKNPSDFVKLYNALTKHFGEKFDSEYEVFCVDEVASVVQNNNHPNHELCVQLMHDWYDIYKADYEGRLQQELGKHEKERQILFKRRLQKKVVAPLYVRFEYDANIWPEEGEKDFLPYEPTRGRWPEISVIPLNELLAPIKWYGSRNYLQLNANEKEQWLKETFGLRPGKGGMGIIDRPAVIFAFLGGELRPADIEPYREYVNIKLINLKGERSKPLIFVVKKKPDIRLTSNDIAEAQNRFKRAA